MRIAAIVISLLLPVSLAYADGDSTNRRRATFIAIPTVYYLPETRFGFGVSATSVFRFRRDTLSIARPSQVSFSASYTQNRQILFTVPFQVFYDNNRYYAYGEFSFYRFNYYFFGIGENEVPREPFEVQYPRIRLNLLRRLGTGTSWYGGLRYVLEDYRMRETQPGGQLAEGTIYGSRGSLTSGLGFTLVNDRRDQVFYPRKGSFTEITFTAASRYKGADVTFQRLTMDYVKYLSLSRKTVLALNGYKSIIWGKAPFNQLSFLGGSRKFRGVYEGRYRDANALLFQGEVRQELFWRIGIVGFGAVGMLGDRDEFIRLNRPKFTYGAGLRFNANRKEHLNIRVDYGMAPGQDAAIYFTVGEAF